MNRRPRQPRKAVSPEYTQEDWDEVSDNPELTDEELATARPAHEVLPPDMLVALSKRGRGRPRAEKPKTEVKLRLDQDVVEAFKSGGPGWQTRMNNALRMHVSVRVEPLRSSQIRPSRDEADSITAR
jgi:uncharacterized protein (DUF4415 family)